MAKKTTTKRKPSKSSKKPLSQYRHTKYFNLDKAASSLSMSIYEIIHYGIRGILTIQTLTAEGNFIVVPSEDLHRFLINPENIIDISELRKPFDYYDEYSYPYADINYPIIKTFVSIKTLLIHEEEFTRFKKQLKSKKKEKDKFDDVKLEIDVDEKGEPLYRAYVSTEHVNRKRLKLEDRFIYPLYLLAKAKVGKKYCVLNKDLEININENADKVKYVLKEAFDMIIRERADEIIETIPNIGRRLMIPKENIIFTRYKS